MKIAFVNPSKCDASPVCPSRRSCPVKAITQEKTGFLRRGPAKVDTALCTGCGTCIKMCPHGAISFKQGAKKPK
ncbi:4Fe-4S ferredoxin-type, iron-sulphur binding domain protein [Acididesulfobacillus acetoxydans]|uniref:4Fe-4S ferredoxin-type iron-sulfur binding domain profile n=1 Tax=Acididesulfobacillus acetoxydans TaxID=1561005 RepID=A0A8S0WQ39_9FIRM|nr:4Fe-4S binding protein [Acididesulfobacillus acetoxydans]CAA7602374.1 4Fe-4S ferredoxin-type, iron-sulphur binding domain protein [Acididesulfobacillus acetoxydans]CEJ08391.1 4Fe-4S ferredoxin-type iron-sulfur binding domain profile [Acididesulfobacillus acetoxydans]